MKKQENYKITFCDNNTNNSKVIFVMSKLGFYLEKECKNDDINISFSSINYNDNNQTIKKNGEITLHILSSSDSNEIFLNKLNNIIEEIKNYYKIDEIKIEELD